MKWGETGLEPQPKPAAGALPLAAKQRAVPKPPSNGTLPPNRPPGPATLSATCPQRKQQPKEPVTDRTLLPAPGTAPDAAICHQRCRAGLSCQHWAPPARPHGPGRTRSPARTFQRGTQAQAEVTALHSGVSLSRRCKEKYFLRLKFQSAPLKISTKS